MYRRHLQDQVTILVILFDNNPIVFQVVSGFGFFLFFGCLGLGTFFGFFDRPVRYDFLSFMLHSLFVIESLVLVGAGYLLNDSFARKFYHINPSLPWVANRMRGLPGRSAR
jgi:hypothetical protein